MELGQKAVNFLATTRGRDKLFRTLQYFCRMLSGLLRTRLASTADRSSKLSASMGITRKVLRFGLPLDLMLQIIRRYQAGGNQGLGWVRSLSQFFGALYFLSDHILYAYKIGLMVERPKSSIVSATDVFNNLVWLLEDVLCIVADAIDVHNVQLKLQEMRDKGLHSKQSEGRKQYVDTLKQNNLLLWDIVRAAGDVPVSTKQIIIFFLDSTKFSSTFVGAIGVVTSLIGCYQAWLRANPS